MKAAAVMQPYFAPYAGYFRLFALADVFVVLDVAQFPRRGWVHRNRFLDRVGTLKWFTLPVERCPRETRIDELRFAADAAARLAEQKRRFPLFDGVGEALAGVDVSGIEPGASVVDYLVPILQGLQRRLGFGSEVIRAGELHSAKRFTGERRIIEIIREIGADVYYNPPGGRELYSVPRFAADGIDLRFLSPYRGGFASVLQRIATEGVDAVEREIMANLPHAPAAAEVGR